MIYIYIYVDPTLSRARSSPPRSLRSRSSVDVEASIARQEDGGTPNSWMVFLRENPTKIWMMTGGSPVVQETPICNYIIVMIHIYIYTILCVLYIDVYLYRHIRM